VREVLFKMCGQLTVCVSYKGGVNGTWSVEEAAEVEVVRRQAFDGDWMIDVNLKTRRPHILSDGERTSLVSYGDEQSKMTTRVLNGWDVNESAGWFSKKPDCLWQMTCGQ
jgi:hypothetical protein